VVETWFSLFMNKILKQYGGFYHDGASYKELLAIPFFLQCRFFFSFLGFPLHVSLFLRRKLAAQICGLVVMPGIDNKKRLFKPPSSSSFAYIEKEQIEYQKIP